jgi:hypothetical protein
MLVRDGQFFQDVKWAESLLPEKWEMFQILAQTRQEDLIIESLRAAPSLLGASRNPNMNKQAYFFLPSPDQGPALKRFLNLIQFRHEMLKEF